MRRNPVGFALAVGMALIVVLFGFTLLSAAGLAGFAADDVPVVQCGVGGPDDNLAPIASQVSLPAEPETPEIAAGGALFKSNCAQCHAVNDVVVGPALAGITKRRPVAWILPWVKNSSKMVASGDDYAVALFNKFNKQQMPSFDFSDKQIAAIVAYIEMGKERVVVNNTIAVVE